MPAHCRGLAQASRGDRPRRSEPHRASGSADRCRRCERETIDGPKQSSYGQAPMVAHARGHPPQTPAPPLAALLGCASPLRPRRLLRRRGAAALLPQPTRPHYRGARLVPQTLRREPARGHHGGDDRTGRLRNAAAQRLASPVYHPWCVRCGGPQPRRSAPPEPWPRESVVLSQSPHASQAAEPPRQRQQPLFFLAALRVLCGWLEVACWV